MTHKEKVALIDGDSIAYMAGYAHSIHDMKVSIANRMQQILQDTEATKYELYIETWKEDKDIFRSRLFDLSNEVVKHPGYKGNRKDVEKPPFLLPARLELEKTWHAKVVKGFEAEDYVISRAYETRQKGKRDPIICCIDKDLLHHPDFIFYDYRKRSEQYLTEDQAVLALMRQIASGDTIDNIPGIKGIGAGKAKKFITDPETALEDCVRLYKKKKLSWEYFIEQCNLIYIRDKLSDKKIIPVSKEEYDEI